MGYSVTFSFAGYRVTVRSVVKFALDAMARAYGPLMCCAHGVPQATFIVRRRAGKLRFFQAGNNSRPKGVVVERGRVMPGLEREINRHLVGALGDRLLLHGAAVSCAANAIILPATTGGGKTTFAAGLVQRGCRYLTDEIVIIQPTTNKVVPFPKAMSLKEGSFALFESLGPDPTGPEYDRVWYLDPERLRPGSVVKRPTPIGWVVFLRYEAGATTRVDALTVGETVLGLFENTVNIKRHKEAGLDLLIAIAKKARGYRLAFGNLKEACEAVLELVGTNGQSCS